MLKSLTTFLRGDCCSVAVLALSAVCATCSVAMSDSPSIEELGGFANKPQYHIHGLAKSLRDTVRINRIRRVSCPLFLFDATSFTSVLDHRFLGQDTH